MSYGKECFCKLTGRQMLVISRLKIQGEVCRANLSRGAVLVFYSCPVMTKKCKAFPHSFCCLLEGCVINKEIWAAKGLTKHIVMVLKKFNLEAPKCVTSQILRFISFHLASLIHLRCSQKEIPIQLCPSHFRWHVPASWYEKGLFVKLCGIMIEAPKRWWS